jgi:putative transposase
MPGRCLALNTTSSSVRSIGAGCWSLRLTIGKELISEVATEHDMTVHTVEAMPDHVHLFVEAGPTLSVAEIVNRFKGRSSRVLRQEFASLRSRLPTLWNRGYYAGSVGAVSESVVRRYIEAQKGA